MNNVQIQGQSSVHGLHQGQNKFKKHSTNYNFSDHQNQFQSILALPEIDKTTFIRKSSKQNTLQKKQSKQFYDQNQYRLYSIASKRRNRNVTIDGNKDDKKSLIQILNTKNNEINSLSNKSKAKIKRRQSSLIGMQKLNGQNSKQIQDLYNEYLTMQELQQKKARKKLQKKMDKYLPKNGSFSQFYGQKKIVIDKMARLQQNQLNKQITINSGLQSQDKKNKQKQRKIKLHQILNNKRLDFKNKLRQRSFTKRQTTPFNTISQKIQSGRSRAQSNLQFLHSPNYSDQLQIQKRFLFFPEPKQQSLPLFPLPSQKKYVNPYSSRINTKSSNMRTKSSSSQYLETLSNLQNRSQLQTKRSQMLINESLKKQIQFQKSYQKLNEQTIQAIYGFSTLKLQEQKSSSYKQQLRNMWMQNDLSKRKRNQRKRKFQ